MADELSVFDRYSVRKRVPEADRITEYYALYMKLCSKYHDDIAYIYDKLKEVEEERTAFYKEKLPEIINELRNQGVEESVILEWTKKLESDTTRSLNISQELLSSFYVKKLDEFRKTLENNLSEDGIRV